MYKINTKHLNSIYCIDIVECSQTSTTSEKNTSNITTKFTVLFKNKTITPPP